MTDNGPQVYVTQFDPQWDFSALVKFGQVIFLTQTEYRPEPSMPGYNVGILAEIMRNLKDYRPGIDYIALTGSAIPNVISGVAIGAHPSEVPHNILKWSRRNRDYELFAL
jgi:hypothetical protein